MSLRGTAFIFLKQNTFLKNGGGGGEGGLVLYFEYVSGLPELEVSDVHISI